MNKLLSLAAYNLSNLIKINYPLFLKMRWYNGKVPFYETNTSRITQIVTQVSKSKSMVLQCGQS